MVKKEEKNILFFNQLRKTDVGLVGGKNSSLGEMYQKLTKKGIRIPNGFATTAHAYHVFMEEFGLKEQIKKIFKDLNTHNIGNLMERGKKARELILKADFSKKLEQDILKAYHQLSLENGVENLSVAVRSSATAEDLPDASFAGQQETFLNIQGEKALLLAVKKCVASLFTNRAISYRTDKGFDHFSIALSVGIQKMVRADKGSSGVMFTIDTESGFQNTVLINSIYGLGENIVQGKVNPDEFYVFKPTRAILSHSIGMKNIKMIYNPNKKASNPVKNIPVNKKDQLEQSISDEQVLQLADWGIMIEKHYKRPMDIEWALDGLDGKLYIVQARPETVQSQKDVAIVEEYKLKEKSDILVEGQSVGWKIGTGEVNRIMGVNEIKNFKKGQVLVTDMTDPDWEPIMKIASAIVTDKGGRTCFSGETKILTNLGFLEMKEITKDKIKKGLYTQSLNRETLKHEWKKVTDTMVRKSKTTKINISQTGRHKDNYLFSTPDHKFITLNNRTLIDQEIQNVLKTKNFVLGVDKIDGFSKNKISSKLAYLWGCIYTDGSVYVSKNHGEVQFIQKQTKEKEDFIKTVVTYFEDLFDKKMGVCVKKETNSTIRGKKVVGSATAFRCYSKEVAKKFKAWKEDLVVNMLNCSEEINYNFLAGAIDGDGTFNKKIGRINIYVSNEVLLQAIVVSCLKLNILPQVTNNRNIYNVQIVDDIDNLLSYTKRIKGSSSRIVNGTKLLSAKSLFYDIVSMVNFGGKIKPYIIKNLLIDKKKIEENILPLLKGNIKDILTKIIKANFVSLRVEDAKKTRTENVYNITVEDNHNYFVFTSKLTPIIVNNCHAAIVSRELGIPCIVGTNNVTKKLKTGMKVTVSCAEGEKGYVYKGILDFEIKKTRIDNLGKPKTKVMMHIGDPSLAFAASFIPNDGVGLARLEFIINNTIKVHPLALINYDKQDKIVKNQIDKLAIGNKNKKQFFIDKLAEGVGTICGAFYPKDVIVRLSDFKTNEYANLIGGTQYEPIEANPMMGWRGAARYYSKSFLPAFEMECAALKKVRDDMGLKNLKIMIPICRTVEEGKKVLQIMAQNGLKRGENGLEVYVMAEVPSNIILAEKFAEIFDGFSIGSNDLTQFTLAIDRDSSGNFDIEGVSNENNEAVKILLKDLIKRAKKSKTKVGICGQAPSDYPEIIEFLVECGIDSISLTPDTVIKSTQLVYVTEKRLKK